MEHVKRIASALVLLPPLVFFLLHASPVFFLILVLMVIGLSLREYFHILQHVPLSVCTYVTWLAALALPIMAHLGDARWLSITLFLSIMALTISVILTASRAAHFFPMLVYSVFGVLCISWTLSHLILLRLLPAGPWYVLFLCAVVWIGDTTAMYVGKSLGHHKMAPAISPGKTWEGLIGGVATTTALSCALAPWLTPLSLTHSFVIGLLLGVAGFVGDITISGIKRDLGIKDSGTMLPGHGGILDRLDSLTYTAPLFFHYLRYFYY